jgi:hypothetical protein
MENRGGSRGRRGKKHRVQVGCKEGRRHGAGKRAKGTIRKAGVRQDKN